MPAWVIEAEPRTSRWAILVHGRGARREEGLRAVKPLRDSGISVLIPSYRNDVGAPRGPDGRYNLGLSEWRDIEDAALYAVQQGARELILVGWSMGGAIVLQTLDRSWLTGHVSHVVLDAPVIDWNDVLAHHARQHGVPAPVGSLSRTLMGKRWARRLVGVHDAVDVAQTNWVARADELRHRMLLIHSRRRRVRAGRPLGAAGRGPAGPRVVRAVEDRSPHQGVEHRPGALGDRGQRVRLALSRPSRRTRPYRRTALPQEPPAPHDSALGLHHRHRGQRHVEGRAPDDARAVAPDQAR